MPLLEIVPSEKLVKMSPKEFKEMANECHKKTKSLARRLYISRGEIREFESIKNLAPSGRRKHQELCARVIELGQEEGGYDLQLKELEKSIRNWFI